MSIHHGNEVTSVMEEIPLFQGLSPKAGRSGAGPVRLQVLLGWGTCL